MSNVEVFERSLHATHIWLNDIGDDLGPDKQRSYHALKAVLHALRDNLSVDESAHLSAQLPMLVRGIYYGEWDPSSESAKDRSKKKFIERVEKSLTDIAPMDPEDVCRAVFRTLNYHLSSGELKQARATLAKPIRALWPAPEEEEQEQQEKAEAEEDSPEEDKEEEGEQAKTEPESSSQKQQQASNVHHLSRKEEEERAAAEEASAAEQQQRERKEQTMPHRPYDEDDDRGYGRGYESGYYDEGRFTQQSDPGYSGSRNERDRDEERYYGRSNVNREYYNQDYDRPSGRGSNYGRHYSGRQYGDRAYRQGYLDTSPRERYYGEENRGDYGRPGGGPQFRGDEDYEDYPEQSRRGWNEGRRVAGNRQSYGYEDEGRWRK